MPRHELIVRPKPSLWDRVRSYTIGPLTTKSPELAKYFGGGRTTAGVTVTDETILRSSAVWSAVSLIADDIASLPLHLYKRLPTGGKDRFEEHPLYRLLHDAPNPEMDTMVWRRTMQTHVLIYRNAYAEIERDGAGRPVALWPLLPETVQPYRTSAGALAYRVRNPSGGEVTLPMGDMIHLVGHSHDGTVGSHLVEQARESIALTLAAEKFGASFFGNGATFGGVISFQGAKPPEMSDQGFRDQLASRHQGVERAYKLLALYNGAKYEKVGTDPNQGQFTETRTFQIREVARWFKMPPHKLGDLADATYSNVEQMDAAYLASCLRPWLVLWEQQLTRKLIAPLERRIQFIEHDTHGFLSVDAQARAELYSSEFRVGSLKPNEIRGYENRDPIDGGDDAYVSLDVMPLSLAPQWWQAQIDEKRANVEKLKQPPAPPPAPPDPNSARAVELLEALRDRQAEASATLAATLAESETARRLAEQRAEDLSAARDEAAAGRDEAEARASQEMELRAGAEQALAQEQAERAREKAEADAIIAQGRAAFHDLQEQRDGLQAHLDDATAARDAAVARVADVEAAREAAITDRATVIGERDALQAQLVEAIASREAAVAEQRAAESAALMATAERVTAEQRAETAEREKGIAEQAQAAANDLIATLQAELQQTRHGHAARVNSVLVAHRALIADVMRRVVDREAERARKHAWNKPKFAAWIDTFYGERGVQDVAEALLPVVRAHLSVLSSRQDPSEMARQLAEDHVSDSAKQLRDLLHIEDFEPMLQRTLAHWEASRPEAVADRLLTKGLTDVR